MRRSVATTTRHVTLAAAISRISVFNEMPVRLYVDLTEIDQRLTDLLLFGTDAIERIVIWNQIVAEAG